jgi:hypothetical protein
MMTKFFEYAARPTEFDAEKVRSLYLPDEVGDAMKALPDNGKEAWLGIYHGWSSAIKADPDYQGFYEVQDDFTVKAVQFEEAS